MTLVFEVILIVAGCVISSLVAIKDIRQVHKENDILFLRDIEKSGNQILAWLVLVLVGIPLTVGIIIPSMTKGMLCIDFATGGFAFVAIIFSYATPLGTEIGNDKYPKTTSNSST